MPKCFVGIDVGMKGSVAVIDEQGTCIKVFDMPLNEKLVDAENLTCLLVEATEGYDEVIACIERPEAFGGGGKHSLMSLGRSFGIAYGVCAALGFECHPTPPSSWKRNMGLSSEKEESIELCKKLIPTLNLLPPRCRVEKHDRAEAGLLAYYIKDFHYITLNNITRD